MLASGSLPPILKQVLSNPSIIKVGRCVSGDLKYLQESCGSTTPFVGGVDLAKLAKERLVIQNATVSLAELCAIVLKHQLPKNVTERVGTLWEEKELSQEQIQYAASDVYASLRIYEALSLISLPKVLPSVLLPGLYVLLFGDNKSRLVARGQISPYNSRSSFDNINITSSRCILEIQEVIVPGAIIGPHRKRTLESFGPVPFHVVCLRSHVRLSNVSSSDIPPPCSDITTPPETVQVVLPEPLESISLSSDVQVEGLDAPEVSTNEGVSLGDLIFGSSDDSSSGSAAPSELASSSEIDLGSQKEGEIALKQAREKSMWLPYIRSRVLKDPFHVFNMFYISVAHGLRVEFSHALRDAIFLPDPQDRARIIAWGASQKPHPWTWDYMVRTRPQWVWKHCKRIIPPPEQLYDLVEAVFRTYGPLKDAKTGLPLFNSAAWAVSKNILDLVQKGFVSDPPDIALYFQIGVDNLCGGLPIYRCFRGTNNTEGGVHRHLVPRLPKYGVSLRHVHACLQDFILCHNLSVCQHIHSHIHLNSKYTMNRLGLSTAQEVHMKDTPVSGSSMRLKRCLLHLKISFQQHNLRLVG
jgi:hypothetical protein